jgi:hypothetical protein
MEPFEDGFSNVAQRGAFRRYLLRLVRDSRLKSLSAVLARVSIEDFVPLRLWLERLDAANRQCLHGP